jgi:hypothetical protein
MSQEIFIGMMEVMEGKNFQRMMKNKGVEINLKTNPQTCTRGCKVTVEVWGFEKDTEALTEVLREEKLRQLEGHEINPELLNQTFDPDAEEVICQACGAKFSPKEKECPECGLVYM